MQPVPQDVLKQYVQSQHFSNTADIMAVMKEMFRDVIQSVVEVEMDEELGRECCRRSASDIPNYRNSYSQKKVNIQLGEIDQFTLRCRISRICFVFACICKNTAKLLLRKSENVLTQNCGDGTIV